MTKARLTAVALACAVIAAPVYADHDRSNNSARSCAAKAKGAYGFQCHGFFSPTGGALEPVTFVGTVEGTADAFYEGFGTFNSSLGSSSTHVAGNATFDSRCFGRVVYTTNEILLPGGGTIPLPPAIFDFIAVDGGEEILGTGVAPGATGNAVPRLTPREDPGLKSRDLGGRVGWGVRRREAQSGCGAWPNAVALVEGLA